MTEPSHAVFLSYASQDADAALRICESLRAAGIEVWLDQSELRGGDTWDSAIRKQIKTCALFLPVISANTSVRAEGYFRLEWKLAVDRSHLIAAERPFILPVVIDGVHEADALVPDRFREVQWTSCPAGQVSAEFVARVARLLSPDVPQAPSAGLRPPVKVGSRLIPRLAADAGYRQSWTKWHSRHRLSRSDGNGAEAGSAFLTASQPRHPRAGRVPARVREDSPLLALHDERHGGGQWGAGIRQHARKSRVVRTIGQRAGEFAQYRVVSAVSQAGEWSSSHASSR